MNMNGLVNGKSNGKRPNDTTVSVVPKTAEGNKPYIYKGMSSSKRMPKQLAQMVPIKTKIHSIKWPCSN